MVIRSATAKNSDEQGGCRLESTSTPSGRNGRRTAMKFIPYWLDTSPQGPDRSGTEIGGRVDVAIVGAGLTGLSAALHLARKGANVQEIGRASCRERV